MKENNDKVLIVVKGGVVQSIYSSNFNLKFEILDFDDEELATINEEESLLIIKTNGLKPIL